MTTQKDIALVHHKCLDADVKLRLENEQSLRRTDDVCVTFNPAPKGIDELAPRMQQRGYTIHIAPIEVSHVAPNNSFWGLPDLEHGSIIQCVARGT